MPSKLIPPVSERDHIQGPLQAPLELLEFGDYQCPHCGVAYSMIKQIQKKLGKRLKFIFRNFPLSEAHPDAFQAAVATEAAAKQNRFWEMHDILFEHQSRLEKEAILKYAKELGLNLKDFENDLQETSLAAKVEADFESGIKSGVNGTPSFYINKNMYRGPYEYDALLEAIQNASRP
jgi:protein-disulfide isomerase